MSVKRSGKMTGVQARVENGSKEGLILAGDLIAGRARAKAPVDTGRLKRSLARGNPYRTVNGLAIGVGSEVEYSLYQELGTKHIKAHPYLRPALEESRKEAITLIAKAVIKRMVRR